MDRSAKRVTPQKILILPTFFYCLNPVYQAAKGGKGAEIPCRLLFFIPFSRRSRYKGTKLCGLKPQNGEGSLPLRRIFFKKRRQPRCCLRVFFTSTSFYKIPYQIIGNFVEACRIKSAVFTANPFPRLILEKKVKIFFSRSGNSTPPVLHLDFRSVSPCKRNGGNYV